MYAILDLKQCKLISYKLGGNYSRIFYTKVRTSNNLSSIKGHLTQLRNAIKNNGYYVNGLSPSDFIVVKFQSIKATDLYNNQHEISL